ncbi:MAG: SDR family NAD(P)-dependent oxidoreductase [Bacteroidetes bacterium]|nr:SDR family NAD(P)-dependent oxidoreductase [Bacteroidota bacterium]
MKNYTVITGASSGLGDAFAHEFARRGHPLILVSLPHEGLNGLAGQLASRYAVLVLYYEADMSQRQAIDEFTAWIETQNIKIDMLVNNAGIGGSSAFQEADADYLDRIIQLNVRGTALLTRALIPLLLQNPHAYILNVSSIAAFSPLPYKMVYPATKAFIYSFSVGLHAEFRERGLRVCVVHPGAMPTNPDIKARLDRQGWLGRLSATSPRYVAQHAVRAALAGSTVIVPGFVNQLNYWAFRYLPRQAVALLASRVIRRELALA